MWAGLMFSELSKSIIVSSISSEALLRGMRDRMTFLGSNYTSLKQLLNLFLEKYDKITEYGYTCYFK